MQIPKRKAAKFKSCRFDPHISQERYDKLNKELKKISKHVQPKLALKVQELAEMGDFSENAAYQIAKGKLRYINTRILEITDILKHAQIIKKTQNKNTVQIGHTVLVECNNKKLKFQILGASESNPSKNIISHLSPLGKALLKKKPGDIITVKKPDKIWQYKILAIE